MVLKEKAIALRRKIDGLFAAGGATAIPILTVINAASPPQEYQRESHGQRNTKTN
jgi:hypothetical protein